MKTKSDLKAALEALQVKKPLRLPSSAPTFAPPAHAADTRESAPLVPAETQVATSTPVPVQTEVGAVTPGDAKTQVTVAAPVATPTPVSVQTQVQSVSVQNQKDAVIQAATETKVTPVTSVSLETPVPAPTQVFGQTQVSPSAPVDVHTPVPRETSVVEQTTAGTATLVQTVTPVVSRTQVGAETPVSQPIQAPVVGKTTANPAGNQDSSVVLESQAAPKLSHGYTRLPNAILMRIVGGELIRSEIQILLLIARFTISFQRRHAPLSKAVLERQTGLRGPAVLQAIADLVAKGLIEKIPGDQYRPNLLGLRFDDEWDFFEKSDRGAESVTSALASTQVSPGVSVPARTPVSTGTKVVQATSVVVTTSAPVAAPTPAGVSAGTHFKDSKRTENNTSLSLLPPKLREYFSQLKPERKRVSEWKAFESLRSDYAADDIADCLDELQNRGVHVVREGAETSERCHSPMAFLSHAMAEILGEVRARKSKAEDRRLREEERVRAEVARREADARVAAEWAGKERAFNRAFPGEERQREVLAELLRGTPFSKTSEAGRTLAIGRWWESLKKYEREELLP